MGARSNPRSGKAKRSLAHQSRSGFTSAEIQREIPSTPTCTQIVLARLKFKVNDKDPYEWSTSLPVNGAFPKLDHPIAVILLPADPLIESTKGRGRKNFMQPKRAKAGK